MESKEEIVTIKEIEMAKFAAGWVKSQPFGNVLSILQLVMLGVCLWYAATVLVPEERKAILSAIEAQELQQTKQIERITYGYEKFLDRMEPRKPDGVARKGDQ